MTFWQKKHGKNTTFWQNHGIWWKSPFPWFPWLSTVPINPSTGSRGQIDPRPYKLFYIEKWF